MPKVKMIHSVVGIGIVHSGGQVYDLTDHVAEKYVAAKIAVLVEEPEIEVQNPTEKREKAIRRSLETR